MQELKLRWPLALHTCSAQRHGYDGALTGLDWIGVDGMCGWLQHATITRWRFGPVALASVLVWAGELWARGPPPAPVVLDTVQSEMLQGRERVTGDVETRRRSLVAARAEGAVLEITVAEGGYCEAAAVLVRLDDAYAVLAVESAEAALSVQDALVAQRVAELEKAESDLSRAKELFATASATKAAVDDAVSAHRAASARVDQAKAQVIASGAALALARQRLKDMRIVAPFSGQILRKHTEVGQWVRAGDPVVELIDLESIEVRLDVPQQWVGGLVAGKTMVELEVAAVGQRFQAQVVSVVSQATAVSRLFPVRVRVDAATGQLKPGMRAVGLVPTRGNAAFLTVHKDAVRDDGQGAFVFAVADGRVTLVRVQSLFASGLRLAVRCAQLAPGDEVVREGNERLHPGQAVRPIVVDR